VLILRLEGALFFVTADSLEERIHELVEKAESPLALVVLDCQSVGFIDAQGAEKINGIYRYLEDRKIDFSLARVKSAVLDVLERSGAVSEIGPQNFYLDVSSAVDSYLQRKEENTTTEAWIS
jgi:SulP family sulfate permease